MFKTIFVWSEVWGLLIPLAIILLSRVRKTEMKPLIFYVFLALLLNSVGRGISVMNKAELAYKLPHFLQKNHIIYNLNSIFRVLLFGWYILNSDLLKKIRPLKFILPLYLLFVVLNFIFLEDLFDMATILIAVESTLLLTLCVLFFLSSIQDDSETIWMDQPIFLICTGLCLYEAVNFFIFLFFDTIAEKNRNFGEITMQIFSATYIILCVLLAIALFKKKESLKEIKALS